MNALMIALQAVAVRDSDKSYPLQSVLYHHAMSELPCTVYVDFLKSTVFSRMLMSDRL